MTVGSAGVSVVLLTLDEELHVARALDSVRWSDNVVVVDSGSRDGTVGICRGFANVTVLEHPFESFAAQRRFALESGSVRHPWVLMLDADEIVTPQLAEELQELARGYKPGMPICYETAMRLVMWRRWLRFSGEYPVYYRRFFRPDACRCVQIGHGDAVETEGPIGRTRHDLVHENLKGVEDWVAKHNRYSSDEAAYAVTELRTVPWRWLVSSVRHERRRALKRLFRALPFNGVLRFFHLYILRLGFLDGLAGLRYSLLKGWHNYIIALKIRELSREGQPPAVRAHAHTHDR